MIQEDLFEERQTLPHGLVYTPEFVSASEAEQLQAAIVQLPFREARFQQYYARRRVVHFHPPGRCETPAYDDDSFSQVMPPFIAALQDKVAAVLGIDASRFIHALVSEYKPGTPIGWHRDKPAYGIVVGLSLAGWGRMRFRPIDHPHDRSAMVLLNLAPRSLYVMQGAIRWGWQHSLMPTRALRYSITFRTSADEGGGHISVAPDTEAELPSRA